MRYKKPRITVKKAGTNLLRSNVDEEMFLFLAATCFLPKTKILMNDRSLKDIEKINIGDTVFSYDLNTGLLVEEEVVQLHRHPSQKREYFIINNTLKVTGNHPIWVNGTSWTKVDELKIGDRLLNPTGEKIIITHIEKMEEETAVFNLGLKGPNNNYFTEGILSHNRTPTTGK